MDSFAKFNKASLGFYNDIIQDFATKVKESIPEEYHSSIDELMLSNQKMLDDAKKVNKKLNNKAPKKPKAPSGWNLFYKAKQSTVDATKQEGKMTLVGELWKALSDEEKGEWNNKAKELKETSSDASDSSDSSDTETPVVEEKKAPAKKAPKKSPAKKGPKKTKKTKNDEVAEVTASDTSDVEDDMPLMDE
jgi:hypothetical protein